ncbi:MAG: prenyltransferase/squalene oxidase repeat-containing protein [Candidatus Thorarchaeota archaeon]|jgi:prenyltransferase beta subunit
MNKVKATGLALALSLMFLSMVAQPATANPGSRLDSLLALMAENFDAAGERGYSLVGTVASRVEATYPAAFILDELTYMAQRPPYPIGPDGIVGMKNFTQKLQWFSGGEDSARYGGISPFIAGEPDMAATFYGIQLWQIMNKHNDVPGMLDVEDINATSLLFYVNKSQSVDGGFGLTAVRSPDIVSTYMALYVIDAMEDETTVWTIDDILLNRTKTVEWILSCREGDAFKLNPASSIPGVTPTAAALKALEILGEIPGLVSELQDVRNWVLDRQVSEEEGGEFFGGFEEGHLTNDTNIVSTFYAIKALGVLSVIPTNVTNAARFIADCQAANGGWGNVPGLDVGTLEFAAFAIDSLSKLDSVNLLYEEDPNNPAGALIDWRVLLVVGFVIVAVIIAFVSLRME